jgi:NMD protein affecting ribosome stability and mRNA decay
MTTADRIMTHERVRRDRQIDDVVHDPYRSRYKPTEPSVCPQCGVVYQHGTWHWKTAPASAHQHTCPACQRIHDHMPAGFVTLDGRFFEEQREVILNLVHNEAERTRAEHPMERIMDVVIEDGRAVVRTTDVHLARRIGDAVQDAYRGELRVQYAPDEYLVRVHWTR